MLHIAHDTYDREPGSGVRPDTHALADRVEAGKAAPRERFVDDRRPRGAVVIVRVECAALSKWDAHRFEVSRADRISIPVAILLGGRCRDGLEVDTIHVLDTGQRQLTGECRCGYARHLTQRVEDIREEPMARVRVAESQTSGLHLHRQQLGRVESRWHREQVLETAQEQSRTDEQHDGQRDLHDDKHTSDGLMSSRDSCRALLHSTVRRGA